jgi:hypothetical protein
MKKGNLAFHAAFHPKKKIAFPSKKKDLVPTYQFEVMIF